MRTKVVADSWVDKTGPHPAPTRATTAYSAFYAEKSRQFEKAGQKKECSVLTEKAWK